MTINTILKRLFQTKQRFGVVSNSDLELRFLYRRLYFQLMISIDGVAVFLVPAGLLWLTGNSLRLTVHSKNDKGSSEKIMLYALAYQGPEKRTGEVTCCYMS